MKYIENILMLFLALVSFSLWSQVHLEVRFAQGFDGVVEIREQTNLSLPEVHAKQYLNGGQVVFESLKRESMELIIMLHDTVNLKKNFISIFAQPGDAISILIDTIGDLHTLKERVQFFGSNAKGQEHFYEYRATPPINYLEEYFAMLDKSESSPEILEKVLERVSVELLKYKELLDEGTIDSSFYLHVRDDIFSRILAGLVSHISDRRNSDRISKNWNRNDSLIKLAFDFLSPIDSTRFYSNGRTYYLQTYAGYLFSDPKIPGDSYFDLPDTVIIVNERSYHLPSVVYTAGAIEQPSLRKYLFASQIAFCLNTLVGMTDQFEDAITYYQILYPDDLQSIQSFARAKEQNALLAAEIPKAFVDTVDHPYYAEWIPIIVDELGIMDSIFSNQEDVDFSAGNYYVDLWATWCGPCLAEMAHNSAADSLLDAYQVERLYLSIDNPNRTLEWLEKIYRYNLGGYHILAGENFLEDLRKRLGMGSRPFKIPRYLWMKDGEIIVKHAAPPSKLTSFREELLLMLE